MPTDNNQPEEMRYPTREDVAEVMRNVEQTREEITGSVGVMNEALQKKKLQKIKYYSYIFSRGDLKQRILTIGLLKCLPYIVAEGVYRSLHTAYYPYEEDFYFTLKTTLYADNFRKLIHKKPLKQYLIDRGAIDCSLIENDKIISDEKIKPYNKIYI